MLDPKYDSAAKHSAGRTAGDPGDQVIGFFDDQNREFVITDPRTPNPWKN
jgi:hypothetical protein